MNPQIQLIAALIVGHFVMDFWAQTSDMAKGKNRNRDHSAMIPPGQKPQTVWPYFLTAHATMHGAAVWYITSSLTLGYFEQIAHWLIDFGKCENWYGIHEDQAMHLICKILWAQLLWHQIV